LISYLGKALEKDRISRFDTGQGLLYGRRLSFGFGWLVAKSLAGQNFSKFDRV